MIPLTGASSERAAGPLRLEQEPADGLETGALTTSPSPHKPLVPGATHERKAARENN